MAPIDALTLHSSPNTVSSFERPLTKQCRPEGLVNEFTEHITLVTKPRLMNLRQDYEKNEPEIQKITFPVAKGEVKKEPPLSENKKITQKTIKPTTTVPESKEKGAASIVEKPKKGEAPVAVEKTPLPKKEETTQKTIKSTPTESRSKEEKVAPIVEESKTGEDSTTVEKKSLPKRKEVMQNIVKSTTAELGKVFEMEGETLTRLIHRESGFNEKAVNPKNRESIGLMQITEVVFDDMKVRYKQFQSLFNKIKDIGDDIGNKLPEDAKKALKVLSGEKPNIQERKSAITTLSNHKKDPYVNMIIGTIYLSFLKNQSNKLVTVDSEKNVEKIEKIQDKIEKLDLKKINKQRKHTGHEDLTKEGLEAFVKSLKGDEAKFSQFLGLVQYNQGTFRGRAGFIYAAVIMATNEASKKDSV